MELKHGYNHQLIDDKMVSLGWTNEEVADRSGISYATVSKIRNGNPSITFESFWRVCSVLKLPMPEVVSGAFKSLRRRR